MHAHIHAGKEYWTLLPTAALSMKFIPLVVIEKSSSNIFLHFFSFLSSLALTWLIYEHREGEKKFNVVMRCNFIISLHIFIIKTHLCDLHSFDVDDKKINRDFHWHSWHDSGKENFNENLCELNFKIKFKNVS